VAGKFHPLAGVSISFRNSFHVKLRNGKSGRCWKL
jgi:hypothetical protein